MTFGRLLIAPVSAALLVSCGAARADGSETLDQALAGAQVESEQALQARIDAAAARLRDAFLVAAADDGDGLEPFDRGLDEWRRRIADCATPDCRRTLLTDQLRRLSFAEGYRAGHAGGLPFAHGRFAMDDGQARGEITLLPIIDDELLVLITSSERDAARWICTVAAGGRWTGDRARMTTFDPGEPFLIRSTGADGLEVRPVGGDLTDQVAGCVSRGWIWGRYRSSSSGS